MKASIATIASNNISDAWAKAFLRVVERGVKEITPLIVTVEQSTFDSIDEIPRIREALDRQIVDLKLRDVEKFRKLQKCHTVANTIFPDSMWNPVEADGKKVFERFERAWPRISRCKQNHRGSYFQRMTAFRPNGNSKPVNQLEHIIQTYRGGNHRRSALQAAVFDPALDHGDSRQLGFPCLHQVAFSPDDDQGLTITGFYATQYLFDRAYGNYLGLCRLGRFMASQMGLRLARMTCVASVAQLGSPGKGDLESFSAHVRAILSGQGKSL